MKIYSWMILPLLTASLFLTGCGSDSDNNDEAPPAAPVVQSDAPPAPMNNSPRSRHLVWYWKISSPLPAAVLYIQCAARPSLVP